MKTKTSQPPARPAAQPKTPVLLPIPKAGGYPPVDRDELLERIAKLDPNDCDDDIDLMLIKALVDSREHYRGSSTPAEELIENLLIKYAGCGRLTPEVVALHVEEFQRGFEFLVESATAFIKANPDLFQELCAEIAATARITPAAV